MTVVGAPLAMRRTSRSYDGPMSGGLDKLRREVVPERKQAERQQRRAARRLRWRRRARLAAITAGHWLRARSTHAPLSREF